MKQVLFAALLGTLTVLSASATVVTFDDLTGSGTVADGYAGITWNGTWFYYDEAQPPYTPESGLERVYDFASEGQFEFSAPVVFDGAWFAGQTTTDVSFNLYLGGTLVGTSSTLGTSSTPTFLSSGYSGMVDRVGVVSNDPDFFVMDNVTFNGTTPSVPEPTTLPLLAIAIALGWFARRRFQHS